MCREKACVLAGILNHYGIGARWVALHSSANYFFGSGHAVVYLLDQKLVIDPTTEDLKGKAMTLEAYRDFLKHSNGADLSVPDHEPGAIERWFRYAEQGLFR